MFGAGLHPVCLDEYLSFGMFQCPDAATVDEQNYTYDRFHASALREDEELLIILRSFIEVISKWHH
jgi:hypothetical protein